MRSKSRRACSRTTCALLTCTSLLPMTACCTIMSASAACTLLLNVDGSTTASNCPLVTRLLKSTSISVSWPDTCEPTGTVISGEIVPEEDTPSSILPEPTAAVS